jgi:hypothetical protein
MAPPHFSGTPAYAYGIDYSATIDECGGSSTVHAWFQPGIYTVEISYRDGRLADLYTLFAGSTYNGPTASSGQGSAASGGRTTSGKTKDPNCREYPEYAQIPWNQLPYDTGAVVVEEPEKDNGYIENSVKVMAGQEVRAADPATAATKIVAAYAAKGSAVNLVMVGHGANTNLSIGGGTTWVNGKYLFMTGTRTNKDFLAKVSESNVQRVKRLGIVGCCVSGRVHELADEHLMCDLARGLAPGDAVTEVLGFAAMTNTVVPAERREGYFTVSGSAWNLHATLMKKGHCDVWQAQKPPTR